MTKGDKSNSTISDKTDELPDYDVGYKKPPVETQFKPGQSGNPKGRPKRSRNMKLLLREELDRPVQLQENGTVVQISKAEGIIKRFVANAIAGNPATIKALLTIVDDNDTSHNEDFKLTTSDADIFKRLIARCLPSNEPDNHCDTDEINAEEHQEVNDEDEA